MELVGVDVGGSTIKLALVEAFDGVISSKVYRDRTPSPPSLRNIVDAVGALSAPLLRNGGERRIGVALPAIIADGRRTVGIGLASDWDGTDARRLLEDRLGREAVVINDADAAGLAEMQKGETAGGEGTVIVLTLGTFIGSALFHDGRLIPNTELGQLELGGYPVEARLGGRAKTERGLSWPKWAEEFSAYLERLQAWFSPSLVVLAGGMTRDAALFAPLLRCPCSLRISRFGDSAGIVGAAVFASGEARVAPSAVLGP